MLFLVHTSPNGLVFSIEFYNHLVDFIDEDLIPLLHINTDQSIWELLKHLSQKWESSIFIVS